MGFVGNYAPCGLAPQIDDMLVILKKGLYDEAQDFVSEAMEARLDLPFD